jgi:hypothetical protein
LPLDRPAPKLEAVPESAARVLIVGLPPLLRDLIEHEFAARPGYDVVRTYEGFEHLAETVDAEEPDYLVVPLEGSDLPPACRELINARSRVKLVGVEEQQGGARLIWLCPQTYDFEDLSPRELITRIEEVAAQSARG